MSRDRTLRLFVGLYPPVETRRAMLAALRKLDPPPDARHRVAPLEQVHMTVQFVGDTDERRLGETIESVHRSAAGVAPFPLRPTRLVTLPERGAPRLIAVETDSPPQLLEMHRRLVRRLAHPNRGKGRDRFLPHLTLCRFTGAADPRSVDAPVKIEPFLVSSLSLMKSVLKPGGAEHEEVARADLG